MLGRIFGATPQLPSMADVEERLRAIQEQHERNSAEMQMRRYRDMVAQSNVLSSQAIVSGATLGPLPWVPESTALRKKLEAYGPSPHPALHEEVREILLEGARSEFPEVRRQALAHSLMPEAMVIMMRGDEDESVASLAEKIYAYGKETSA